MLCRHLDCKALNLLLDTVVKACNDSVAQALPCNKFRTGDNRRTLGTEDIGSCSISTALCIGSVEITSSSTTSLKVTQDHSTFHPWEGRVWVPVTCSIPWTHKIQDGGDPPSLILTPKCKNVIFSKTKHWCLLTTYKKSYMSFQRNRFCTPKIQDGGDPPSWKSTWRHFFLPRMVRFG